MTKDTAFPTKDREPIPSGDEGRPNQQQEQPTRKKIKLDYTEMLSDEILLALLLQCNPGATTLSRLSAVNKRFRLLLQDEIVVKRVTKERVTRNNHSIGIVTDGWSWKDLGFYERIYAAGLFEEHRIGFDFASADIDDDTGDASMIPGSISRVDALARIVQEFDDVTLIVEAHCGTAAPAAIAPGFSLARGEAVCVKVANSSHVSDAEDVIGRITVNPWGRRVAYRAAASSHKFGEIAREGRGWVEVYLKLGDVMFPQRPSYYEGLQAPVEQMEEEEPIMFRILWE
jgi:hypothetical protein